jgi:uncharacterized delta-60 repeat protein
MSLLSFARSLLFRPRHARVLYKRPRPCRPALEVLEDRLLLSGPGTLDPTFNGGSGWTTVSPSGDSQETYNDVAQDVAILPDGKILVGGDSQGAFGLVRLTPEGNLDSTFGTGGRVRTLFSTAYQVPQYYDMALQGDGKIVAVGQIDDGYQLKNKTYVHNLDQLLMRYNANGSLDTTFGSGGIVTKDFSTYDNPNDSMNKLDQAWGVAIESDGKIVVGGRTMVGPNVSNAILVRYNTDGTLDLTFGTGGKVIVQSTTPGAFYTPWLQTDGKIVASGFGTIARFNSDGTLDDGSAADSTPLDAFGTGGMVLQHAIVGAIQPDGKILTVGTASNGVNDDIIVYRLNPDGTADTNFGIGGAARIDAGGNEAAAWPALAVGSDGSIVVAGYQTNADQDSLIARLTPQGKPDETFAPGGVVVQSFSTSSDMFRGVALQPDGQIVAVGSWKRTIKPFASDNDFLVARYMGDPTIGPATASPNLVSAGSTVTLAAGNIPTGNPSSSITQVANLGGATLGLAAGNTIWLNANSAGWDWFADPTPHDLPGSALTGAPSSRSNGVAKAPHWSRTWDEHSDTLGLTDTVLAELAQWADHERW